MTWSWSSKQRYAGSKDLVCKFRTWSEILCCGAGKPAVGRDMVMVVVVMVTKKESVVNRHIHTNLECLAVGP